MPETWSTRAVPRSGQFEYWRELICAAFLALTPESDLRDGFAGSVTQWQLGAADLARIDSQRQRVRRTENDLDRAGRPGYYANLQVHGVSTMRQAGRETVLRPGDLALVDTRDTFAFEFANDFRQLSFFVPDRLLGLDTPVPTATRLQTATGVGAAVRHTLLQLPLLGTPQAARLATHIGGLLAVALDRPGSPPLRAPRTYAAALADIEEHLADDTLTPAMTARRLGVSVRTVHGLFAGRELTYAATVRRARLERARQALRDPDQRSLRVIDIATEAGFADVSSFHRAFRRAYGVTPAQARQP